MGHLVLFNRPSKSICVVNMLVALMYFTTYITVPLEASVPFRKAIASRQRGKKYFPRGKATVASRQRKFNARQNIFASRQDSLQCEAKICSDSIPRWHPAGSQTMQRLLENVLVYKKQF